MAKFKKTKNEAARAANTAAIMAANRAAAAKKQARIEKNERAQRASAKKAAAQKQAAARKKQQRVEKNERAQRAAGRATAAARKKKQAQVERNERALRRGAQKRAPAQPSPVAPTTGIGSLTEAAPLRATPIPVIAPQGYGGGTGGGAGAGGSRAIADAAAGNATPEVEAAAAAAGMSVEQYMAWAKQFYAPLRAQLEAQWKKRLAEQGILSSTAAVGQFLQNEQEVGAKEAAFAEEARRWDIARQDTERQKAFENSLNTYSTLQAGAIGQAPYSTNVQWPGQPKMFQGVYNYAFQPPTASRGNKDVTEYQYGDPPETQMRNPFGLTFLPPQWAVGPTGDAPQYWPTRSVDLGSRQREQQAFESAEAGKNRALQERQMEMQAAAAGLKWVPGQGWVKDETSEEAKQSQMWSTIGQLVAGNLQAGRTEPGKNLAPSELARIIEATYNLDLSAMVRAGDQQAVNIVLAMWPKTGARIIKTIQDNPDWDFGQALTASGATPGGESEAAGKPPISAPTRPWSEITPQTQFGSVRGEEIIPWTYQQARGALSSGSWINASPAEQAVQSMGAAPSEQRPWYLQSPASYFFNSLYNR